MSCLHRSPRDRPVGQHDGPGRRRRGRRDAGRCLHVQFHGRRDAAVRSGQLELGRRHGFDGRCGHQRHVADLQLVGIVGQHGGRRLRVPSGRRRLDSDHRADRRRDARRGPAGIRSPGRGHRGQSEPAGRAYGDGRPDSHRRLPADCDWMVRSFSGKNRPTPAAFGSTSTASTGASGRRRLPVRRRQAWPRARARWSRCGPSTGRATRGPSPMPR